MIDLTDLLDKAHIEITTKRSEDCDKGEGRGDGGSCRCKIRTLSVYIPIPGSTSGCLAAHRVSKDVLMDSQINSPFIFMSNLEESIVMTPDTVQSEGGDHLRRDYAVLRHKPIRLPRGEVALLLPKDHIFFPIMDTNRMFNIECLNTSGNTSYIQHVGILTVTRGILAISRYLFYTIKNSITFFLGTVITGVREVTWEALHFAELTKGITIMSEITIKVEVSSASPDSDIQKKLG